MLRVTWKVGWWLVYLKNSCNSTNNDDDEIVFHEPPPVTSGIDDEGSDDEGSDDITQTPSNTTTRSFACQVTWHWNKHKQCIDHAYSIADWALCVIGSVWTDVRDRLSGEDPDAIEKIVARLHLPPCPNSNPTVLTMLPHKIIDTFRNEFKAFQNCKQPYQDMSHWASSDCVSGKSYLWQISILFRTQWCWDM